MTRRRLELELIVDNFAGGGGASLGIEQALNRSPDIAVNHDKEAIAMHRANHPNTTHYECDVHEVDPKTATQNRPVGLAWFSPDCTDHSKAKGGKPIRESGKKSRSLANVVIHWAKEVRPRVIILENVEEFQDWGPVIPKIGSDGEPELDSSGNPFYIRCQERKGTMFNAWVKALRDEGYAVEWRELRACDFGAPTIRKRLFVIARCDGKKIVWPKPTHADPESITARRRNLIPWNTTAGIIDWFQPCHSIFLSPEKAREVGVRRPLANKTLDRIAAGMRRYVLDAKRPFLVFCNHGGSEFRGRSVDDPLNTVTCSRDALGLVTPFVSYGQQGGLNRPVSVPMHTITASRKDTNQVVMPVLSSYYGPKNGKPQTCTEITRPLKTQTTENRHALVCAFMAQHNGGMIGHSMEKPTSTITIKGSQQQLVAAHVTHLYGTNEGGGGSVREPARTVTAGGYHAGLVAAFLAPYYGSGSGENGRSLRLPTPTTTTRDRFQLVTVSVGPRKFVVNDIGMRMLTPRELFRAQGFPDDYIIDPVMHDRTGTKGQPLPPGPLPKSSQVRMCGNSVCPDLARVLVEANYKPNRQGGKKPATAQQRMFALTTETV